METTTIEYSALVVSGLAIIIAIISAIIAEIARKEVKTQYLFSGFQQANQATIENINFLKDVHGLKDLDESEYRNIAYLSVLMDAFQHEGNEYKKRTCFQEIFSKPKKTTFLDNIISIPENRKRWESMKDIYYADYDKEFVSYIDKKFENIEKN